MSRRFTVVTVALTAIVAFLVGAIVAGGIARSSIAAGPATKIGPRPSVHSDATASVVNFADVVERINPAVVNIDATTRGKDTRRRGRVRIDPPDPFDAPDGGGRT